MPNHPQSYFMDTIAGAPATAVNAIQTVTIAGGPPTTMTFRFRKDGVPTGTITWSNVNATLLSAINTALDAAYGTGSLVATAGTLTAGIGTILLTAGAKFAGQVLSTLTAEILAQTGTATTIGVATTTAGVNATHRDAPPGALVRSANGNVYRNSSPAGTAVSWVAI